MKGKMLSQRIVWSNAESEAVAQRAAELLVNDQLLGRISALKQAQRWVLPTVRWRSDSSLNGAAFGPGKFKIMLDAKISEINAKTYENWDQINKKQKVEPDDYQEPEPSVEIKPTIDKPAPEFIDTYIDAMIGSLTTAFRLKLRESLQLVVEEELAKTTSDAIDRIHTTVADIQKLPKIVVVGMRGIQITKIREEFSGVANLSFIDADDSMHRAQAAAKHASAVVVMKDFISHSMTASLKKVSSNVFEVGGGIGSISNKILEIIA